MSPLKDFGMSVILEDLKQISAQLDANIIEKLTYLPKRMKMTVQDRGGAILVNTGMPSDMFNVACLTDYGVDLESIAKSFRSLPFAWWVGFENVRFKNDREKFEKCKRKLEEFGLKNPENELGMYADIRKIERNSNCEILRIAKVADLISLRDFVEVYKKLLPADAEAIERFYLSAAPFILENDGPLKLFVGYVGHRPAATAALFLHANAAGVWDVTTLPDFRNLGIATNIVRHMLFYAYDVHNYRVGVLTATKSGESVYRKLGFQKIKEFFVFNVLG